MSSLNETKLFNNNINNNVNLGTNRFFEYLLNNICLSRLSLNLHTESFAYNIISNNTEEIKIKICSYFKEHNYIIVDRGITGNLTFLLKKNEVIQLVLDISNTAKSIDITMVGDINEIEKNKEYLNYNFKQAGTEIKLITMRDDQFYFTENHLSLTDDTKAFQCFYPNLKLSLDEYYKKFIESNSNVLLLIGPPGTGKSTFIRSLIAFSNYSTYLTYDKAVIEASYLIDKFHSSDKKMLVLEDMDSFLGKRENGNSLMATYLNASEGVIKRSDKKIIFSTNLSSIDKVDPALLRRGRCFDIIKFDLLTTDQAYNIETTLKLPKQDYSSKEKWSLSEVMNPVEGYLQTNNRTLNSISFI